MFYPSCPKCGGETESAEPHGMDHAGHGVGHYLHHQATMGHPHPYLKAAHLAITLGRQIYKRVPGGGEKRCKACGHRFR